MVVAVAGGGGGGVLFVVAGELHRISSSGQILVVLNPFASQSSVSSRLPLLERVILPNCLLVCRFWILRHFYPRVCQFAPSSLSLWLVQVKPQNLSQWKNFSVGQEQVWEEEPCS